MSPSSSSSSPSPSPSPLSVALHTSFVLSPCPSPSPGVVSVTFTTLPSLCHPRPPPPYYPSSLPLPLQFPLPLSSFCPPPPFLPSSLSASPVTVVWFRSHDLRVDDHPALFHARGRLALLVVRPLSTSDPNPTTWNACVRDLALRLRHRFGAVLHVRDGHPRDAVPRFCGESGATHLHFNRVVGEEEGMEGEEKHWMMVKTVKTNSFWTGALYCPGDNLPMKINELPDDCDQFGRLVAKSQVNRPLDTPTEGSITSVQGLPLGHDYYNNMNNSNNEQWTAGHNTAATTTTLAGESLALQAVRDYVTGRCGVASVITSGDNNNNVDRSMYTATTTNSVNTQTLTQGSGRNSDNRSAYRSSGTTTSIDTKIARLGPLLSMGCVSPRRVWHDVVDGLSPYSVRRFCAEYELLLRDFKGLSAMKSNTKTRNSMLVHSLSPSPAHV